VYLVGAGPGDPELMTVRGATLLARADVVIYDRLIAHSLLDLAPPSAERIDVGKRPGRPTRQSEINALLVEHGGLGHEVVRLKGGDPFLFGRGGEEAEALRAAGIPYEVVPGVTSAFAAPAAAGIPVTHRGLAADFAVVSGHRDPERAEAGWNWAELAVGPATLVLLMGMDNLAEITAELIRHGRPADTPAAVIQSATLPGQRVLRAPLGGLAARSGAAGLTAPAVVVIGAVAALGAEPVPS
jgi:uroporphyrin-III C-methyltransferase